MASKAKKAATNFAKDINETMQASLALYTLEKVSLFADNDGLKFLFVLAVVFDLPVGVLV